MELVVALAVGTVLTTGMIQLALATTASFQLQQALAGLQETDRFLGQQLQDAIRPAGFHPQPWTLAAAAPAIGAGSADAVSADSDRLELQRWSDRNCFDNPNPALDGDGQPRYDLRITRFELRSGNLVVHCRYGADTGSLVTQINNLGLAEGVEAFAVRYAEDSDADGSADRWVDAGQWGEESHVLGLGYALVLASAQRIDGAPGGPLTWPGGSWAPPADGKLRWVVEGTVALAGRLP
jgi:hypothetical protein